MNPLRPGVDDLAVSRDLTEEVTTVDPPTVEYEFAVGDDTFRVRVDETLYVSTVERSNESSV